MSFLQDLFSLKERVAVVVGGSGVLGGAMAEALGKSGARVAVVYNRNERGANERIEGIKESGGEGMAVQADASSKDEIKNASEAVISEWGKVDILVNAPGINSTTPVLEISEKEWGRILDVNLKSVFLACQVFGDAMIDGGEGGSIINITSVSSLRPLSKVFTYSISKTGINSLTRFLAREWAPHNIRVNAIAPGFFPAEQNRRILTEARKKAIFSHTPMNRYGEPDELCGAVVWLASEKASSFVTGEIVTVDGGFSATTI